MINQTKASFWLMAVLTATAVIALVLSFTMLAHGTTTRQQNATGFVQYIENPLMYVAATLAPNQRSVTSVDGNLNLRIKPLGTYMLYDESILFCGMPLDKFRGIGEPFLLTFERVAHRTVQGIACHNLVRVDNVVERQDLK